MQQILLQNATAILLQNATKVYYKIRQIFYYKMPQLLQNATIQYATFITKCVGARWAAFNFENKLSSNSFNTTLTREKQILHDIHEIFKCEMTVV